MSQYTMIFNKSLAIKESLENKNRLLRKVDPDMDLLDEQIRSILGYAEPDEFVIIIGSQ